MPPSDRRPVRFVVAVWLAILLGFMVPVGAANGSQLGEATAFATPGGVQDGQASALTGVVTGPDGARLPGAIVTITNSVTGASYTVVTADHGGFQASSLPPGDYQVKVELQGFQAQSIDRLSLRAGQSVQANFTLSLSTLSETVNVVASNAKDTLAASEIRESTARDIGEALGEMNGVAKERKGAIANDIALNGFQSRNLTVLIDGERIYGACPNGMDPAVFHADFAEVDHLEVGKGPFDVRHQGSLGGVVNVVTRRPGEGLHLVTNLSLGSSGVVNPSVTGSYGTSRVSALGGFSYRTADPYRDGAGRLFTDYANYRANADLGKAYEANTRWARLFVSPRANHSFQITYTQQRTSHILYPYLLMDGVSDNADRLNASYEAVRDGARVRTFSARAYYTHVSHWMTDALRVSSVGMTRDYSMATQADTKTAGATLQLGIGKLTAGIETFRRQWNATTMMAGNKYAPQDGIPFVTVDNAGVFAEYQQAVARATRVEIGGRFDASRSRADAARVNTSLYYAYKGTRSTSAVDVLTSAKARLTHQAGDHLQLETGVGRTVRVPDPQERYFALRRAGNDWVGNPALEPTANNGVNVVATYRIGQATASGALYYERLTNFITVQNQRRINAVSGVTNASARSYANVDARMTTGEATVTWPLTDRLFASASASYTRGTKTPNPAIGISSRNIAEIHPVIGSARLRYGRSVVFAEAQLLFSGRLVHVDSDLREEPVPGYGLLNLHAGAQKKKVRVTVAVDNVFNRLYVDPLSYQRDPFRTGVRVREPGRNVYANVGWRF